MVWQLVTVVSLVIIIYLIFFLTKNNDYWKKRNTPHLKPTFLFGNHKETILLRKHITQVVQEICQKLPQEPYIGTLYGTRPVLIVKDPDLIRLVLSKDFSYFSGRELSDYSNREPITNTLFFSGGDKWKVLRQNLTPHFSSAKVKGMFHLIKNCANEFEKLLEEKSQQYIDVRSLFARYTIDCITSCAFGFDAKTMSSESETNPFMIIGKKIFSTSPLRGCKTHFRLIWPDLFYGLGLSLFESELVNFFYKLLKNIFIKRESEKSIRNDFVDQILTWKHNSHISGAGMRNKNNGEKQLVSIEVDNDLLAAQCLLFFGAGFETTAITLSFLLYELAKNKEIQEKLIKEIDSYIEKCNEVIEYECVNELPYLEACIDESSRLYPVLGILSREVMEDHTLPTGLLLEKGTTIHIPVQHLHLDAENFSDPYQFRPERFYGEERKKIKPFTYLPFGEGPRTCIGLRFSKMPMYMAILMVFKRYKVELAEKMPQKMKMEPTSITICPTSEINIKFIPRNI